MHFFCIIKKRLIDEIGLQLIIFQKRNYSKDFGINVKKKFTPHISIIAFLLQLIGER